MRMEVALFLNNLKKVKLESPERNETIERIPPKDDRYEEIRLLNKNDEIIDSKKWQIFPKAGELPDELRQDEMVKQYEYDLRIAVSENLDDDINRLFSYFKTEVKFPFPAIIYGTFDLDAKSIRSADELYSMRRSRTKKKFSQFFNRIPSGSARVKPAYRKS